MTDVKVFVDGVLVAERADGSAIPLDPGPHQLRYERAGSAPIHETIVALEAETYRRLDVVFTTQDIERTDPVAATRARKPIAAYALGAAGMLSLGAFVYLNFDGQSEFDACKESRACTPSAIDALETKRYVTWAALSAGVVAVGAAGVWLLTSDSSSGRPGRGARSTRRSSWSGCGPCTTATIATSPESPGRAARTVACPDAGPLGRSLGSHGRAWLTPFESHSTRSPISGHLTPSGAPMGRSGRRSVRRLRTW